MMPFLGEQLGIFDEAGLDLEFVTTGGGPENLAALASGSVDFSETVPVTAFPAMEKGADVRFLMNDSGPIENVIARPGLDLPNRDKPYPEPVKDLKGMKIGITARGAQTEQLMLAILEQAGMSADDVTFVAVGGASTGAAAFNAGEIDAMVGWEPMLSLIGEENFQTVVSVEDVWEHVLPQDMLFVLYAASGRAVESKPEVVETFCTALADTFAYALDPANKEDVVSFLESYANLTTNQAEEAWGRVAPAFSTELTEAQWESLPEWYPTLTIPSWDTTYAPCVEIGNQAT